MRPLLLIYVSKMELLKEELVSFKKKVEPYLFIVMLPLFFGEKPCLLPLSF